jgi:serine/threonine protein kinase/tetratricopeptide (TPR) repeat protein/TolB-like protein
MVECPACHTSNPPESRLCSKCSAPFGIDTATLVIEPPETSTALDADGTQVFTEVSLAATAVGGTGWSVPVQKLTSSESGTSLQPGVMLGERYEILKSLGEGGMGAVYKARDHELDRMVALKVIRPELAGHPDILRRFKQELILARQVTHKNVVRIFDLGTADGRKFITMDFIEGRDLKSILNERGKISAIEAVPIVQQICRGLEAAHAEGVVHRDLKPQNIMVDDAGRVWLMDFGLARSMELSGLTRTGVLMGTPDYMSPEQARAEKVDARSDLFSLGIIFFEMLTGRLPFQADTLMAKLLQRVQQRAVAVTEIDPAIPPEVSAVVSKCLEPDITKRYQTIREVLDDLSGGARSISSSSSASSSASGSSTRAPSESSPISLVELGPGSQFGPRYRIEAVIGEGGMGKVYKAYDSDLDRTVALKLVRPELAKDGNSLQRFKQELLLASRISHRNILRIHDLGDVDGVKFISMAFVQGMDLHDLIAKQGRLPTERAVNIAKQLAGALEAAHAEGVVHRDLKPRNVLIDVDDHIYISDFGLAKSLDADKTGMTRVGEVLGTPRYMSPEQAESKAADNRSDIYSLGIILYEMLTGEVPFTGESSLQVMFQHVQQQPKDPRLLNPEMPEYLATIILKCLEKDPALRYQSAKDLLQDLESGTPPTRIVRLRQAEMGYPKWLFAVTGVVLLAGVGMAIRPVRELVLGRSSIQITSSKITGKPGAGATAAGPGAADKFVALLPLRVVGNDPTLQYEASGVMEALSAKLFQMKNVHLASTGAIEKINAADPVTKIAHQLGSKLIVQGSMQGAGDKIDVVLSLSDATGRQLWTKDFPGVRQDLLTIEDQIYNEMVTALELKPSDEELARNALRPTENVGAYELYLKGRDILRGKRDVKRVQSAVDLYEQAIKKDPAFALAYAGLADASLIMYNFKQDPAWSEKALSAALHAQTLNDEIPEVHFALGNAYKVTGKTAEAVVELKRALTLAPNSDEGYRRLGDVYLATGKEDDAIQAYQRAIDANPYYWLNHNRMGTVYFQLGQNEKALAAFRRVMELAPESTLGYDNIGAVYFREGKWNDAIVSFGKALKIAPSESLYSNLGTAYFYLGHRADAVAMFQKALALSPADHEVVGNLADGYRWSGDTAKAKATYEQAIALALKALRVNSQDASTLGFLASYYAKNGDSKKGIEFIRRARSIDAKDNDLMYKEAVVEAIAGQQADALASLRAALEKGYPVQQAKNDPELKALATNPELDKLIAGFERKTN